MFGARWLVPMIQTGTGETDMGLSVHQTSQQLLREALLVPAQVPLARDGRTPTTARPGTHSTTLQPRRAAPDGQETPPRQSAWWSPGAGTECRTRRWIRNREMVKVTTRTVVLVRYRPGVTGQAARTVHLVPRPGSVTHGAAVSSLCGALFTYEQIETVTPGEGMPCTMCLLLCTSSAPVRLPTLPAEPNLAGGSGVATGPLATAVGYRAWGWPVTLRRDQVTLNLDRHMLALIIPIGLASKVKTILAARRWPAPVLAHPSTPSHRVVLVGEPYGVALPWPAQVQRATGTLPLPPTVTPRGPVTWAHRGPRTVAVPRNRPLRRGAQRAARFAVVLRAGPRRPGPALDPGSPEDRRLHPQASCDDLLVAGVWCQQHNRSMRREEESMASVVDDPLASIGMRSLPRTGESSSATSCSATRPLALRGARPAAARAAPEYVYDPQRQIATDPAGHPLGPCLEKQWTTTEGTHTDGDGGDNENWGWEE